ncbi:MAG: hypothetical protein KDI15_12960, partial [Thiothrix sp.]|nr:hypothetical protein [Thiothrix sp.]
MEEWVGKIWDRVITRSARREYPQARVRLEEMNRTLGLLLRALSGEGGLQVRAATDIGNTASRTLLQRVAGTGLKTQAAWRETEALCLPDSIAVFPQRVLNRDLYLWLTALGSLEPESSGGEAGEPGAAALSGQIQRMLQRYPALEPRYRRLQAAWQALYPEQREMHSPLALLAAPQHPAAAVPAMMDEPAPPPGAPESRPVPDSDKRHRGQRTEMPDGKSGLLMFRLESFFSWTEYLPVNRTTDDEPDEDAARAAEDLNVITVARDRKASSHKIRLDLDLPSAEYDDLPLEEGIALPEWDYR